MYARLFQVAVVPYRWGLTVLQISTHNVNVPSQENPTHWIAQQLGFLRLEESGREAVPAPEHPVGRESEVTCESLLARSLRALGIEAGNPGEKKLTALLEQARAGERGSLSWQVEGKPVRVLALPAGPGLAEVWIAPQQGAAGVELERRAGMSDMAASVSHEVSNALSAISGWVELLRDAPGSIEDREAVLERIGRCATSAQGIARRLLDVMRTGAETPSEDIAVGEVGREVVDLLQLTARSRRVALECAVLGRPVVHGVRADLFSALWNLSKNAVEACEEGDQVRLMAVAHGDRVEIEVVDTGSGMDAVTLERVLEPYFTTKESGTGLGMGLARRAAAAMGGEMQVESTPGKGTRVRLVLPRVGRQSATFAPVALRAPRQPAAGNALADVRVLVVDDDHALREMVSTALELKGAIVTACRSSAEALATHDRFDIALIDMMLSDGRGDELLANLRRRGKVEAAMLVTGMVNRPRMVPGGEPDDWIRKPFELGPLTDRIRQTLERHRMLASAASGVAPG